MPDTTTELRLRIKRDVDYMKPDGYEDYKTLSEVAVEVRRDPSWIRKLESDKRIPRAYRVKVGKLSVRLWSPEQIEEIKHILSTLKRGRPSNG